MPHNVMVTKEILEIRSTRVVGAEKVGSGFWGEGLLVLYLGKKQIRGTLQFQIPQLTLPCSRSDSFAAKLFSGRHVPRRNVAHMLIAGFRPGFLTPPNFISKISCKIPTPSTRLYSIASISALSSSTSRRGNLRSIATIYHDLSSCLRLSVPTTLGNLSKIATIIGVIVIFIYPTNN